MLIYVVLGTIFGFLLSRSGAADYGFIQGMFLFESIQLYGIMGVAVAIAAPGLWLIKRRASAASALPGTAAPRPPERRHIIGGLLFGVGWSIAGMCPGPIFVNLGEGKVYALAALAGALVGTTLLGALYPRLLRPFRLPPLQVGAGEG